MFSRRELVTGGLAATAVARGTGVHAQVRSSDDNTGLLNDILNEVRALATPQPVAGATAIAMVRQSQRAFLKQAGKFPDQIEVGLDVWEAVIDWYVATRQPVEVFRMGDGRYAIRYVTTAIVLKQELPESYVSQGQ